MQNNLNGLIVVRNHKSLDYIPIEACKSLLRVCYKVYLIDLESDDGSYDLLSRYASTDNRVQLITRPWTNPFNKPEWWVDALNDAKQLLPQDQWLLQLDADEILGHEVLPGIQRAMNTRTPILFRRHNFWRDPQHIVPENRCCGEMVARAGPVNLYLPSDEPHPKVHPNLRTNAVPQNGCNIYHYGFLRDKDAFVRKTDVVQKAFIGSADQRVMQYEKMPDRKWDEIDYYDGLPLRNYRGGHPPEGIAWLRSRGHRV